ncbi:hypothetical protein [Streptomyces sp. NPDC101165]|uniref:hypothetical protein n=1 Tax=Streptomyces sp. NPDC101165 TaxID=3366119 RepID=UPI003829938F
MNDRVFVIDTAWSRVIEAREQNDRKAEALALTVLGQALFEDDRQDEAAEIDRQARELARGEHDRPEICLAQAEALLTRGNELEQAGGVAPLVWPSDVVPPGFHDRFQLLTNAHRAYDHAQRALQHVDKDTWDVARTRSEAVLHRRDALRPPSPLPHLPMAAQIIAGFVALKVLSPFLEEFAKKLGERLGESMASVLGRIRLRRRGESGAGDLQVDVPGSAHPTTLVLPGELSDAARLAIIELDPTDECVRGATLYWNELAGAWTSAEELEIAESMIMWVIRYTWVVTDPEVSHPRHTYDRAATRQEAHDLALRRWSDRMDGLAITQVHIRQGSDIDWGDPLPFAQRPVSDPLAAPPPENGPAA